MQLLATALLFLTVVQATPSNYIPRAQSLAEARLKRSHTAPRGSCKAPASAGTPDLSNDIAPFDQDKATVYRYRQQQAVNLGNWFVHEEWMGASTYVCATGPAEAEIDIARGSNAKAILEHQWDTFITEADFQYLSSVGINTVRMPLGFWSLGSNFTKGSIFADYADVYENSWPRVLRAIGWAGKYGIGVLADMHGAYGSQNGQAHSGVSDGKTNLFSSQTDQDMTIAALVWMTEQLSPISNVVGIEILNEPKNDPQLLPFYTNAITAMRAAPGGKDLPLYVHDGFDISEMASFVGKRSDFVVVDHHSYFVFQGQYQSMPVTQIADVVTGSTKDTISSSTKTARGNLVTDEWGCALADGSTHVSDLESATATYCKNQESVYREAAAGYSFWSFMLDGCEKGDGDGWCFRGSVGNLLPSTFFSYAGNTDVSSIALDGSGSGSSSNSTVASSDDNTATTTTTSAPAATKSCKASTTSAAAGSRKRSAHLARRRHHQRNAERASSHSSSALAVRSDTGSAGYTAGQKAAQTFYSTGGSRVGFVEQYCKDTYGSTCDSTYLADFEQGVSDESSTLDKGASR